MFVGGDGQPRLTVLFVVLLAKLTLVMDAVDAR